MRTKLRFLFTGKSKDRYIIDAIEKYQKILKKYGTVEIVEIKSGKGRDVNKIIEKEKKLVLNNLEKDFYTILLDIKGSEISTEKLAEFFNKNFEKGKNKFQFIIGGAFGVDSDLTNNADFVWKLSELTFNHQMVRIILLEQVYRVLSIINGESYHH